MRLVALIPAALGRVSRIRVRILYNGTEGTTDVDVTDVQLQPVQPTGVVPHPADVSVRRGATRWRNGIIPRSTPEVILMADSEKATPTRWEVQPAGPSTVRIGNYRFGALHGAGVVDGQTGERTQGWGRPPVITERSDGHVPVSVTRPIHVKVRWSDRT